jgi:hypothetical protein
MMRLLATRYAIRSLTRDRGLPAIVILYLTLGIGINAWPADPRHVA